MERRLARIWQNVLGRAHIGVTDDFFELGGHSLTAVRLMGAMHAEFGRTLPLASLLQHTTIERMAVALGRAHDARDWRPLVEIRGGGAAPPLFLLPGAGGNVIYFHALARHLAPGRPIYALQATGLDGVTPPLTSVEAIAASHLDDMRRAWPAGPYYLAGHSFGGRVALEMARQLQRAGDRVALLAALDTAAPIFDPAAAHAEWTDAHWLERIAREIEAFFGVTLRVTLDDLVPLPIDAQLALVIDQLQRAGAWAPGADAAQLAGYLQVYKANTQMPFASYDGGVSVPIALFKAQERDQDVDAVPESLTALMTEQTWGWNRFALGDVTVVEVPGAHLSMLAGPHAATLAARLDEVMASAEARPRVADTEMSL
jgi:thioesterase domain-containing protein/acyl carrier protein